MTTPKNPTVAELMAALKAAQDAAAAEKARADKAEADAKARGRGYSLKVSDKTGIVCINGVNAQYPATMYASHLVGVSTDLILSGKLSAFLRENAARLSVKVNDTPTVGTDDSRKAIMALADRLDAAIAAPRS